MRHFRADTVLKKCLCHFQINVWCTLGIKQIIKIINFYNTTHMQGRREVRGALRQNIFKITAFEKIVANFI